MTTQRIPSLAYLTTILLFGYQASAFYNPNTGLWLSRDPADERGGKNLYAFDKADAINSVDRDGRWRLVMESINAPHETSPCGGAESHVKFRLDFAQGLNGWLIQHVKYNYDAKNCDGTQNRRGTLKGEYWEAWRVIDGAIWADYGGIREKAGDDSFVIPDIGDDTKGVLRKEGYSNFYEDYDLRLPPWTRDYPPAGGIPAITHEPFPWSDTGKLYHFLQANYDCCCAKINIVTGLPWW